MCVDRVCVDLDIPWHTMHAIPMTENHKQPCFQISSCLALSRTTSHPHCVPHPPCTTPTMYHPKTQGWQWLFLLESLPTFLMALWIWRTLAPSPSQSHFLTPPQRAWLVARCAAHAAAKSNAGAQQDLRGALLEYRTWWMSLTGLLYTCAKYSKFLWVVVGG